MEQVGYLAKGKGTFVFVYTVEGEGDRRGITPLILNLCTGWSWDGTDLSQFHLNRGTGRQKCRCIVPKTVYTV